MRERERERKRAKETDRLEYIDMYEKIQRQIGLRLCRKKRKNQT